MSKESNEFNGLIQESGRRSPIVKSWHWLLHLGFRLLYNELAWTYDGVSWLVSLGRWQDWGKASLPFIKGPKILELAHGPGHMQLALNLGGFQSYGIDQSPYMSKQARKRIVKNFFAVHLVRGEAQYLPYRNQYFDTVLATFPTEFIVNPQTLENVRRVLKPRGRLVVVIEGRLLGGGPIYRFIEWLFEITGQRQVVGSDGPISDIWMEVDKRLGAAGFKLDLKTIRSEESEVVIVVADK
jgi:SAM-dependent methyltransferase